MLWLAIACGALAACGGGGGGNGGGGTPPRPADADNDTVADAVDCAPNDAARWQLLSYQSRDADGDGFRADATGQVCSGSALPASHGATTVAASDVDCNDADAVAWRLTGIYADADGDGVGAGARTSACVGKTAPAGYSLLGYDPLDDPSNPASAATTDSGVMPALRATP